MTTSTKRRARRQAPQAAVSTDTTEPAKKCVLCQNTNAGELADFGPDKEYELPYYLCFEVGPCVERAFAARQATDVKPETEATAPAEDAEATS